MKPFPPQADLGFAETDADLLPQKAGQCLLTFTDSLLALQSTSGDMIMLENLYFRYALNDFVPSFFSAEHSLLQKWIN